MEILDFYALGVYVIHDKQDFGWVYALRLTQYMQALPRNFYYIRFYLTWSSWHVDSLQHPMFNAARCYLSNLTYSSWWQVMPIFVSTNPVPTVSETTNLRWFSLLFMLFIKRHVNTFWILLYLLTTHCMKYELCTGFCVSMFFVGTWNILTLIHSYSCL